MSRDCRVYLEDVLEAARRIRDYTRGFDAASFATDSKTQDAVVRNLWDIVQNKLPDLEAAVNDLLSRLDPGRRS